MLLFLFIITILVVLIVSLRFEVEIEKFSYSNITKKIPENFKIKLRFYLFNYLKILELSLNKKKLEKISNVKKFKKINKKNVIKKLPSKNKEKLKLIKKIKIQTLDLNLEIGAIDIMATITTIPVISTMLSFLLAKIGNKNCKFKIMPIYKEEFVYKIDLNCIISIKMIHIINIMWIILRKRDDKYDRTSNRRFNAYSYE